MKVLPRFLYLAAFTAMALAAAFSLDAAVYPSMSVDLVRAVTMGTLLGAAGLVHRRAWGVSLVLLPIGAYLFFRVTVPPSTDVEGARALYHFYIETFAAGGRQYLIRVFPFNLIGADELRLVLGTVVYCTAALGSFLALSLRRPIAGIMPVLILLGFSVTIDTVPRTLALTLVFLLMAACVMALARSLERRVWRLRDAVPGVLVGGAGAALAVVLLGAAPSAAASPWQDWRTWQPFDAGGSTYSFNWLQNYPQLLSPANNAMIMRVESPQAAYWRANALEEFTGEAWISSQGFPDDLQKVQREDGFVYSLPAAGPTRPGTAVTERFQIRSVYTNYFFSGGDPRSLTTGQDTVIRTNEARALHVVNALGPQLDYTLKAVIPKLEPDSLVGLGEDYPEEVERYLALPFPSLSQLARERGAVNEAVWRAALEDTSARADQWDGLYTLNKRAIGDATDPYQVALKLERFLRRGYQYTLEPPGSDLSSPYAAFLFDTRLGYCQHFAGTMAMLLRYNGIPARVAVGFTSGERESAGVYLVSTNNAHAWVEAYFPSVGWVEFDPTPGRSLPYAGASSTSPGFTDPFADGSSEATTATTLAEEALPRSTPQVTEPGVSASGASSAGLASWLPWVVGLLVIVVAWPYIRRLWRERGLRRGTLTQRFAASLGLLRQSLASYGVAATGSSTLEDVLDSVEKHLGLHCDPVLATRAGAVLFGGRHARSEDLRRAESFRRDVETGLRRRCGWFKAVLSWYGVPPAKNITMLLTKASSDIQWPHGRHQDSGKSGREEAGVRSGAV